ncbi:hypothetical protein F52700_2460 [Fusarium sp. NRRL 52700]|nr:hypothetical protein F52700_2460 [Fusarium sp. NRRL 52700]
MASHRRQLPCNLIIHDGEDMRLLSASPDLIVYLNNKGLRLSFLRDPDRHTFSWYSADLTMTESALHHVTIELPPRGFTLTSHELTSDEKAALSSHLPEDSSGYKIIEIDCQESTTITGFGLPFHGANETVESWVNQHTLIKDIISLPDILHRLSFTLLAKATSAEITHAVSTINYQHIPPDYGYGEESVSCPSESQANITGIGGTWTDPIKESVKFVCLLELKGIFEPEHWRAAHRALRGDLNKVKVRFTLKDRNEKGLDENDREKKHKTGLVVWEAVPLTIATCDELSNIDLRNRIPLGLTRPPSHNFNPITYDDYETAKESRRENVNQVFTGIPSASMVSTI